MKDRGAPGIPNGWYAVAWSKDLGVGDVQRIRYFDNEMVLFRTRSGKARVLDAYCPHLGAHLAEGGREKRLKAIRTLASLGDPRAREPLERSLIHLDPQIRAAAAEALASLGEPGWKRL